MLKNMGTFSYSETLPCTGRLVINPDSWHIVYTFSGPDLRYKIHNLQINSDEVESYIQALEEAWNKYLQLKQEYDLQGKKDPQVINFKQGIYISAGYQCLDGISLSAHGSSKRITSENRLKEVIQGLRYAIKKAQVVMTMLKTVESHLKKVQDKI
jgi:maltodextrin utilization protein YvdJ